MSSWEESGAYSQIQRIAKLLGYEYAWPQPSNPERWFVERKSGQAGYVTVNLLEAEILRHIQFSGLDEPK